MIYDVVSQASPAKASFIEQHFVLLAGAGVGRTPQPNENCACEVLSISVIVFFLGEFFDIRGIFKLHSLTLAGTKTWLFELRVPCLCTRKKTPC